MRYAVEAIAVKMRMAASASADAVRGRLAESPALRPARSPRVTARPSRKRGKSMVLGKSMPSNPSARAPFSSASCSSARAVLA